MHTVDEHAPCGMVVYALSEMKEAAGLRTFQFTNWHEPDESKKRLSIVADELKWRRPPETR